MGVIPVIESFGTHLYQNGAVVNARPISVDEYDRMIEHGILTDEDQVELLNGVIIEKMTKGTRHASVNGRVNRLFSQLFGDEFIIRIQDPIWLDDYSEPEPDIVIARADAEFYADRHPRPKDILLLIEIADTSLTRDRYQKGAAYAAAGIQQYVILNVADDTVEDYRSPEIDGYASKQTYRRGEAFSIVLLPSVTVNVDELL